MNVAYTRQLQCVTVLRDRCQPEVDKTEHTWPEVSSFHREPWRTRTFRKQHCISARRRPIRCSQSSINTSTHWQNV